MGLLSYVGKALGKAALGTASFTFDALGAAADGMATKIVLPAADLGGRAAIKTAKGAVKAGRYMAEDALAGANSKNRGINVLSNTAELGYRLAGKFGTYTRDVHTLDSAGNVKIKSGGLKATKLEAGVLLGAGALGGMHDVVGTYMDDRVGPIDPNKVTATPKIEKEEYHRGVDNAGATGDLVFALHNNRRG